MMPSCRSISVWLRRDRLTNMAFRFARSIASSPASRTASLCTWSKARATSPISSVESMPMGSISTLSSSPGSLWLQPPDHLRQAAARPRPGRRPAACATRWYCFDLGDGRAQHVDERDRLAPAPCVAS